MANNQHAADIREKRNILRAEYGGMMSIDQLARELGYRSHKPVIIWAKTVGLEGTRIGHSKKYDTDRVAKILVELYGMC